ncbi:MAG: hypothetical protein ACKVS8_00080 [Phycisphaerales bacterium]
MKKPDAKMVLGFLKKRWLMLVCLVVMLAAVPVGIVFGSGMSQQIVSEVKKKVDADLAAIGPSGSDAKVAYSVPARGTEAAVEVRYAPNERMIEAFKAQREGELAQLTQIAQRAREFNASSVTVNGDQIIRKPRTPLVEGLFPQPKTDDKIRRSEFQRLYLGKAHADLLSRFRCGPPANNTTVREEIAELLNQQQKTAKELGNTLTPEDEKRMLEEAAKVRLGKYQRRAGELSFYFSPEVFALPAETAEPPLLNRCWDYQVQYWIREDILAAAAVANIRGRDAGVPASVVKRIDTIAVAEQKLGSAAAGGEQGEPGGAPAAVAAPGTPDARSITGRFGPTTAYDLRHVRVVAIVATRDIPAFVDALAATNFMSVVSMDLEQVDPAEELRRGYYYGPEHVSRVSMTIETIWLYEWLAPLLPPVLRQAAGLAPDPSAPEGQAPPGDTGAPPTRGAGGS